MFMVTRMLTPFFILFSICLETIICSDSCPELNPVPFGKWKVDTQTHGGKASLHCQEGYKLVPNDWEVLLCFRQNQKLTWYGEIPECVEELPDIQVLVGDVPILQHCIPPEVTNGRLSVQTETVHPGESLDVECLPGYRAPEQATMHLVCMDDGTWDDSPPVCSMVKCNPPRKLENGLLSLGVPPHVADPVFPFGMEISYSCDVDFNLVGPMLRWCDVNGWTGEEPYCEAIVCKDLPEVRNGRVQELKQIYLPGEEAQVNCNLGYMPQLGSLSFLTCTQEGTWNTTHAHCIELMCESPLSPANGSVVSLNEEFPLNKFQYKFMEKVAFHCQPGFTLVGKKIHHCREKGWSDLPPTCKEVICSRPTMPKSAWIEGDLGEDVYASGHTVSFRCPEWYQMIGASKRTCTERGWTGEPIDCKLQGCPSPKPSTGTSIMFRIKTGYNRFKNSVFGFFGERLVGQCPEGFRKNTNLEPICMRTGQWSSSIPDCIIIVCYPPRIPVNSFIQFSTGVKDSNYVYGSTVRLGCKPGFRLTGNDFLKCTGTWSGSPPYCQEILCEHPSIDHGRAIYLQVWPKSRHPFSTIEIICEDGYRLIDENHVLQCTLEGLWNDTLSKCQEIQCDSPNEISNGSLVGKGPYYAGSSVSYRCHQGFTLQPPNGALVCTRDGWNGPLLSCQESECWLPDPPGNGSFTVSNPDIPANASLVPAGTILTFLCTNSYVMNGEPAIICLESEMWSAEPPQCEAPYCLKPVLENSYPIGGHFRYQVGHVLEVQCVPGYLVRGNSSIECSPMGQWIPSSIQCEEVLCDPPPLPAFGEANPKKGYYVFGDTIHYKCLNPAVRLKGKRMQTCTNDGWSDPVPSCVVVKDEDKVTCSPPPGQLGTFGFVPYIPPNIMEFNIGDRVTVTCGEGFKPVLPFDNNYIICAPNGTWSTEFVKCVEAEEIPCLSPPALVNNGRVVSPKMAYQYGETVSVACNPGYRPANGTYFLSCLKDGHWDQNITHCEAVWCEIPVIPANGTLEDAGLKDGSIWPFHSEANFVCLPGFQLVGHHWIKCLQNGWSSSSPQCREITCDDPGTPDEGFKKGDIFAVGARVTFGCFSGYQLIGPKERICLPNGQWSQHQPYCQAEMKDCPELAAPTSGFKKGTTVDGQVTFTCPPGYSLIGSRTRKCHEGSWSGSPAQCIGKHQFDNKEDVSRSIQLLVKDMYEEQDAVLRSLPKHQALTSHKSLLKEERPPQHLVVYFVIDASSSIGRRNFERAKFFARSLIEKLDISRSATRVGLITFSSRATAEFYPTDFHSSNNILAALEAALYTEGGTSLQTALEVLKDMMTETEEALEGGVAGSHVFLLTDGKFNAGINPGGIAKHLKEQFKAKFTCLALTGHWRKEVLYSIASDRNQVFFLHSFTTLEWLAQQVKQSTLDFSKCGQGLDSLAQPAYLKRLGLESTNITFPWPWTVFIYFQQQQICKGSLISREWILTSARCVLRRKKLLNPKLLSLELGIGEGALSVSAIHVHPNFNASTNSYNSALLRLESPVTFNEVVQPICLPKFPQGDGNSSKLQAGEYGYVSSWTSKQVTGNVKPRLRHLSLPFQSQENCLTASLQKEVPLSNTTFCAGDGNDEPSGANGDNGGPFIQVQLDNVGNPLWVQVGITSFQMNSLYSFYTDVSKLMDWIRLFVLV